MARRLTVLLAALALAACGGTTSYSASHLATPLAHLPDSVPVRVWPYPKLPDGPYQIVGEVSVERSEVFGFGQVDRRQLLEMLKDDARRMGADGIVSLMGGNEGVTWRKVDQAWFWGIAVRFTDGWVDREATERQRHQLEQQGLERVKESTD